MQKNNIIIQNYKIMTNVIYTTEKIKRNVFSFNLIAYNFLSRFKKFNNLI